LTDFHKFNVIFWAKTPTTPIIWVLFTIFSVFQRDRILKIGYVLTKLSPSVGGPLFGTQCSYT